MELTKQEEFSIPEESKNFSFHQKEEKGGEVRRTERKWKSLSKQEREAFLAHAHENHEKNDSTKEHMKDARKEIVKKNQECARPPRNGPSMPRTLLPVSLQRARVRTDGWPMIGVAPSRVCGLAGWRRRSADGR